MNDFLYKNNFKALPIDLELLMQFFIAHIVVIVIFVLFVNNFPLLLAYFLV